MWNNAAYFSGLSMNAVSGIRSTLITYFQNLGSSSVASALDSVLYTALIQTTSNITAAMGGLMIMLQLSNEDTGWVNVLEEEGFSSVSSFSYQLKSTNTPQACLTGKTPSSPVADSCVCAPGYTPNGEQ